MVFGSLSEKLRLLRTRSFFIVKISTTKVHSLTQSHPITSVHIRPCSWKGTGGDILLAWFNVRFVLSTMSVCPCKVHLQKWFSAATQKHRQFKLHSYDARQRYFIAFKGNGLYSGRQMSFHTQDDWFGCWQSHGLEPRWIANNLKDNSEFLFPQFLPSRHFGRMWSATKVLPFPLVHRDPCASQSKYKAIKTYPLSKWFLVWYL